ncbi:MAG TPA: hypothetical protein PK453_17410 [Leptospiraceae bacterium]|nr:hypothetical protein [Leptospiraceae bacterium]HNF15448.1 hypothetical protein [Leptospiraceae bacterium]HNH09772.1 hypothetical protein [Leptospiraceae bacterium]HNI96285.1 hypothetical protein [Leptospiraceae bacterium]HNM03047.1 hypothetical protein [Leptospiraceae bacterium]
MNIIAAVSLFLMASFLNADSAFKKVSDKEKEKILKKINFERIKKNLDVKLVLGKEKSIPYSNCSDEFPSLPGSFPCSFLSYEDVSSASEETGKSIDVQDGGFINIKVSEIDSAFGGKLVIVSPGEESEFLLKIFYRKDGFISHYINKNSLIFFDWVNEKEGITLKKIYLLELDEKKNASKLKRVEF